MSILPQLERDLHEAARRRLPAPRPRRSWLPHRGAVATLAGVAVALAVALIALSLRGQQPPTRAAAPLKPPSYLGLHQLLDRFAELRRPQTAFERRVKLYWAPGDPARGFIPRFTRLATTLPDGERVFLTVTRVTARDGAAGQPAGSYMLSASLVGVDGKLNLLSGEPSYNHLWDYTQFPVLFGPNPHHSWVWVSIVPDGVKAVGWVFPPRTYVVPVHGNVAAALLPGSAGTVIRRVLWYGAHQQVVRRFVAPIKYVLSGIGIAGARLGAAQTEAVSQLRRLLGKPQGHFVPNFVCGGADIAIHWQDLTTFFRRGRFVAYSYWEQVLPTSWPLLATARGLTIGETPAYASRLYGRAFRTSRALGGTWSLATTHGVLDGFTYGAEAGPRNTITTIEAGPRICQTVIPQGLAHRP